MAAAWIIQVVSWKRLAPILEHAPEPSGGNMRLNQVFWHIGDAASGHRRIEHRAGAVKDQLTIDAHLQFAPAFLELPGIQATASRQTQIDTVMVGKVLRLFWRCVFYKI